MGIELSASEVEDRYCLREGEADALLAGHPWRRFAALGDSIAEGLGEPSPGYPDQSWVDRVVAELTARQPGFTALNLGRHDTRSAQVRATQLGPALAFGPDLALVACGGADLLSRSYAPDEVEGHLHAIVAALRESGCDVITVSMFDGSHSPAVPEPFRAALRERLRDLSTRTRRVSAQLGTVHVDLIDHPASADPGLYGADGRHGTRRAHAISAAETVRRLGAHLGEAAAAEPSAAGQPGTGR
jgi:lysophospholipase L1-like esterase